MRQWLVDPKILCRNHLFGEHLEHHMFVGTINKGIKIDGYIKNNLLEPLSLKSRHEDLVKEISLRGFNHKSNLPTINFNKIPKEYLNHTIDKNNSFNELISRCEKCRQRYKGE